MITVSKRRACGLSRGRGVDNEHETDKSLFTFYEKKTHSQLIFFFLKTEIRVCFVLKLLICSDSSENEVFFIIIR